MSNQIHFPLKHLNHNIHEFLEENFPEDIEKYNLQSVTLNVLNIERTFTDKIMSVKRHAICGTLNVKVRHIYDVVRLFNMQVIKDFLENKEELKRIISLTKKTDSFYLLKRNINKEYDPKEEFNFGKWKKYFDVDVKNNYERLHKELLFTNQKQDFNDAISVFEKIDKLLKEIGE